MLGHDVLTLLDVGGVHDGVVLHMTLLPLVLDGLLLGLAEALEVVLFAVARVSLGLSLALVSPARLAPTTPQMMTVDLNLLAFIRISSLLL